MKKTSFKPGNAHKELKHKDEKKLWKENWRP
jgi:hypothetical protein